MNIESNITTDDFLDFRRIIAFVGLLELSRKCDEMKSGRKIEILVQDEDTVADIRRLLSRSDYEMTIQKKEASLNRITIKKIRNE